ncbi:hypothetical protein [Myxococcus qinghaiensis]|uniref:hypothetical protein n=1 Tax=Myxococcus qinghaiensis TaxID=2906758 RepID=UPI0020A7A763|nr:hypothetical protein [Myxococcus qinghaiensis]MCP3166396.1 hypothetical protein [Myxococcus qinghaiensis]
MTDHLRPEAGLFSRSSLSSYESEVARLLIPDASWRLLLVSLPSFAPEEAVYLRDKGLGPQVVATRMETKLWPILMGYTKGRTATQDGPAVEVARAPIAMPLLEQLSQLWVAALLRTRFPRRPDLHLDGTTYHLGAHCRPFGILTGHTWSPPLPSLMAGLVDIGAKLTRYARAPEEQRSSIADALLQESTDLHRRFEAEDAFGGV